MKTTTNTPAEVRELGALAALLAWMDRHPRTATAIMWLLFAALAYAVVTYDFTIPMYK